MLRWLSVLLLFPLCAFSQTDMFDKDKVEKTDQEVYAEMAVEDSIERLRFLIIPFEEKLFYCDIMRDLTEVNSLNRQQVFDRFRNDIQLSLRSAMKDSLEAVTFLSTDSITNEELIMVYSQLGYGFVPVPVKEEKGKKGKKKKVEPKEKKAEVGIRNGQVIAERDNVPRYMNAKLKNATVLGNFYKNYGINRFLFINQMDVKMDLSDPETAFTNPKRMVALHYTIFDQNGKQIIGGLASQTFGGAQSNINRIIGANFHRLSSEIMGELKSATKKVEEENKKKRKSKTKD